MQLFGQPSANLLQIVLFPVAFQKTNGLKEQKHRCWNNVQIMA